MGYRKDIRTKDSVKLLNSVNKVLEITNRLNRIKRIIKKEILNIYNIRTRKN